MRNFASILKVFFTIVVIILIAGYIYYRTKDFIYGPVIIILSPENGSTINDSPVEIHGKAKNISYLSINDRQIFTDEDGNFNEKLLLSPGYNIISAKARDKFERNTEEALEIIYKEKDTPGIEIETRESETSSTTNNVVI